jgi:hypothetical protein
VPTIALTPQRPCSQSPEKSQRFNVALGKTVIQNIRPNTTVKRTSENNRNDKTWGKRAVALPVAGI